MPEGEEAPAPVPAETEEQPQQSNETAEAPAAPAAAPASNAVEAPVSNDQKGLPIVELIDYARSLSAELARCMTRGDIVDAIRSVAGPDAAGVEDEMGTTTAASGGGKAVEGPYRGKVKVLVSEKGYAFLSSEETQKVYQRDVYVKLRSSTEQLQQGDLVEFSVSTTEDGKPQATKVQRLLAPGRYRGAVKSYQPKPDGKGYGFISCSQVQAEHGRDVFVSQEVAAAAGLYVGAVVEFSIEMNPKGHPQGRSIRLCYGHPVPQPGVRGPVGPAPGGLRAPLPAGRMVQIQPGQVTRQQQLLQPQLQQREMGYMDLHAMHGARQQPQHRLPAQQHPIGVGGMIGGPGAAAAVGGQGRKWLCPRCGFNNRPGNTQCGGQGQLGCKMPRPAVF